MKSQLGQLVSSDVIKSAVSAAIAAVLVAVAGMIGPSFDLFNFDWKLLINMIIGTGLSAFLGDILRRLGSDHNGAFLGKVGGDASDL